MKKKAVIIISILILILLVIISAKTITIRKIDVNNPDTPVKTLATEEILMQVLNGEKEFIFDGKEVTIVNLNISDAPVNINQYAFADLDGDSENEMIAVTDSYYGYYLVLHIENNIIYGYDISLKDMDCIGNNGLILDTVDSSIYYRRLIFNKNKYKKTNVASFSSGEYMINGEVVEQEEFDTFQDEFARSGILNYKILETNWMIKKLNSEYSMKTDNSYTLSDDERSFVFALDNSFENFRNDMLEEKINLYYIDSNNNFGRILIKRHDDTLDKFVEELNNKKSVGIFDEDSQYIAVIINNDRLSSSIDNTYDIYYFKYYNKSVKLIGKNSDVLTYLDLFNEDIISDLND